MSMKKKPLGKHFRNGAGYLIQALVSRKYLIKKRLEFFYSKGCFLLPNLEKVAQ